MCGRRKAAASLDDERVNAVVFLWDMGERLLLGEEPAGRRGCHRGLEANEGGCSDRNSSARATLYR